MRTLNLGLHLHVNRRSLSLHAKEKRGFGFKEAFPRCSVKSNQSNGMVGLLVLDADLQTT